MTRIDDRGQTPSVQKAADQVSDRGLRVFAAAAALGSLTAAARQLGMGQPAVSHAVTRLESAIGTPLLHRSRTGVLTTSAGHALLTELRPALTRIDEAVALARSGQENTHVVSISVSTSLASWWLLPRLPDFKRAHPDVSLRLVTADSDAAVDMSSIDLWIPLGRIDRPELDSSVLCREELIPVAAPSLAQQLTNGASGLADAPLVHLEERYEPRFNWHRWFAAQDVDVPDQLPGDRSNDYSLVLQAALDGQGVALGWAHIVASLIEDGQLVPLAEPISTDAPFVILSSRQRQLSPGATALRNWLVQQLA
jgi:LysR family glycine cleavage system transcriptional activator